MTEESGSDDDSDTSSLFCPHINSNSVDTLKCGKKILKPSLWSCQTAKCGQFNSLFACLTCGYISCVNDDYEGHAEDHCYSKRRTKHPIAIHLYSHKIWCFLCETQINVGANQPIHDFIYSLKSLQSRHLTRIQCDDVMIVSSTKNKEFQQKDKSENASAHYEMILIRKIFNHWKVHNNKTTNNMKHSVSGVKRKRKDIETDEKSIKIPPKKKLKRTPTKNFEGRTGLRNLGNTCYFNSSVQCLRRCDTFRKFFLHLPSLVPKNALTAPLPDIPHNGKHKKTRNKQSKSSTNQKDNKNTTNNRRSARLKKEDDTDSDTENDAESNTLAAPSRLLLRRRTTSLHAIMEYDEELSKETPISLSAEVYSLLRIFESGKYSVVTPHRLAYSIWNTVPQFCSYRQQDAQEFLCLFLERLELEIQSFDANDTASHYVKKSFECCMVSETTCDECKYKSYYRPPGHYCITLDIYGSIKSILDHKKMEIESNKNGDNGRLRERHLSTERAFDRTLKSYGLCSLMDLLKTKSDSIVFEGDNSYECSECNKRVRAVQRHFIEKIPNVLVFHLCRAYYNLKNDKQEKLKNHISFPLKDLRMDPYCFDKEEDVAYDLVAALVHSGRSMTHGHYIAYCYQRETDRWLKFDDVRVTVTTAKTVKESQAYLLFYEKQNISNWADAYIHNIKQ